MYKVWKRLLPRPMRDAMMIAWYDRLARWDGQGRLSFLNHGYAPTDGPPETLELSPDDAANRYWIQLYDHLARRVDWSGKRALEVSSGPGGGADWLARAYAPATMTGIDLARASIRAAERRLGRTGLRFKVGDAQAMPFADGAFDIVVNVESSLNYPDFGAFLAEVDRVLAPGGALLIADYRSAGKRPAFEAGLDGLGYATLWREDLTAGVARALALTQARKATLVDAIAPWPFKGLVRRFADLEEDGAAHGRRRFETGARVYLAMALRKPMD